MKIEVLQDANLSDIIAAEKILTALSVRNPAATAATLINAFGSFATLCEATPEDLGRHVSPATAKKISAILTGVKAYHMSKAARMNNSFMINNRSALEELCTGLLAGEREEHFCIIAVNAQCKALAIAEISEGSLSEVAAYPRKAIEAVIRTNAHSVFLCHNHPGGTCAPSAEDIQTTTILKKALETIGCAILDHIIVAGNNCYSLRVHGDM